MDKLLTLAAFLIMLSVIVFAIRNYIQTRKFDEELKAIRIDLMTDYNPEKYLALKAKFDRLFSKKTAYDEALYVYYKQFMQDYKNEYAEYLINEK